MTSIAKNAYIDKLDDIVKKYNNAYRIIKKKPLEVKPSLYIDFSKEINKEGPNLKIVIMLEYQNIKMFLNTLHIVLKEIKKVKNVVPRTYNVSDLKDEVIVRTFYKK